jgi:ABC-type proline/glycine betaine transport system substrate-binding protein
MRNVAALVAILMMVGASTALAQASPSPPAASSSTTAGSGTTSASGKMSDQVVKKKLESEGYTQVTDITSTPKGTTANAMKGDKAVTLVIDFSGHVNENKIGP